MDLAAMLVTLFIASSVDIPFRKPYWLEASPPASYVAALSLVAMTLSKTLPKASSRQMGL